MYAHFDIDSYVQNASAVADDFVFSYAENKVQPDMSYGGECINNRCVCKESSACRQCDGLKRDLVTNSYTCKCANVRVEPSVKLNCINPDTELTFGEANFQTDQRVKMTFWATRTDGSIFPPPFVCGAEDEINDFRSQVVMTSSGWFWEGWSSPEDAMFVRLPAKHKENVLDYDVCFGTTRGEAFCGYSRRDDAVSLSFRLKGDGVATVKFGNGVSEDRMNGTVTAYLNGTLVRELPWSTVFTTSVAFEDGDLLEFVAEDGGVIVVYPLGFNCTGYNSTSREELSYGRRRRLLPDDDNNINNNNDNNVTSSPTPAPTTEGGRRKSNCTEGVDALLPYADTVGSCGVAVLAEGSTCRQSPASRCSPSSCGDGGVFTPGACAAPLVAVRDPGFHADAAYFLRRLGIALEEGEGALLSLEVTGMVTEEGEGGGMMCEETPVTYSYLVERVGVQVFDRAVFGFGGLGRVCLLRALLISSWVL
jgi:hypothetical protein